MLRRTRKILPKLFSFALLLAMVLTVGPLNAFAATLTPQRVYEITDLRTENSKTFLLDNGQYQVDVYASDIYYRDSNGSLQEISNKLVAADSDSGYEYTNEANSWHSSFKEDLSSKDAVSISQGDYSVSFNIMGAEAKTSAALSDTLKSSESVLDRTYSEDNRVVMYKGVFPSTDIAYTTFNSCLKEDIILRDNTAPSEFSFDVSLKGLTLSEDSDGVCLINTQGDVVFRMMPLYMEDATGKSSDSIKYSLAKTAEGYKVTISADRGFLADPTTVFPVVIDPTYDTKGSSYTSDTYITQALPDTHPNTSSYLYTGLHASGDIRRTYIRFKLPSGYTGITVATLKVRLHTRASSQSFIKVYRTGRYHGDYWTSGTLTWNNRPLGYDETLNPTPWWEVGTMQYSNYWYTCDVKLFMQDVYGGYDQNHGFLLKNLTEVSPPSVWDELYSSDCGDITKVPVLHIECTGVHPVTDYFLGNWAPGVADDLTVHVDTSTVPAEYYPELEAAYCSWNGINTNVNFDSITLSNGNPTDFRVRIIGDDDIQAGTFALTGNMSRIPNTNTFVQDDDGVYGYWEYSEMKIPTQSNHAPYMYHSDIQLEGFMHEFGHVLGLKDLEDTTTLMQHWILYFYPMVCSHDKNTLNHKYQ
jgi:hypothetical protein